MTEETKGKPPSFSEKNSAAGRKSKKPVFFSPRMVRGFVFCCVILLLLLTFAGSVVKVREDAALPLGLRCENIVVLTGGKNRIQTALDSIKKFHAKNVFISGVNRQATLQDILAGQSIGNATVTLGYKARNTEENAKEVSDFVRDMGINEILLVTSDYHMNRSLREIERYCPKLRIYPLKVRSKFSLRFFWLCAKEEYLLFSRWCREHCKESIND